MYVRVESAEVWDYIFLTLFSLSISNRVKVIVSYCNFPPSSCKQAWLALSESAPFPSVRDEIFNYYQSHLLPLDAKRLTRLKKKKQLQKVIFREMLLIRIRCTFLIMLKISWKWYRADSLNLEQWNLTRSRTVGYLHRYTINILRTLFR